MNQFYLLVSVATITLFTLRPAWCEEASQTDPIVRQLKLRAEVRSWIPGDTLETYRKHSLGTCSNGGVVGIGAFVENGFEGEIRCVPDRDRIAAELSIRPTKSNQTLKPSTSVVEMSDLRPKFIEVTKDEDGRVYVLSISPEIVEIKPPKAFTVEDISPFDWDFPQCPVVLNDEIYVGRIGMSGGSLAGISIAGVADLKFSLKHLKNAEPIGVLQNGMLTIEMEGTVIAISGVRNGGNKQTLPGPYTVWVRSTAENVSGTEYKRMMALKLETLQKRKSEGDVSISDDVIERVKSFVEQGRPMLVGSSARDVRDADLAK